MDSTKRMIYLIRHAESLWNSERRVQGTCLAVPLSPRGRAQAQILGKRLKALPLQAVYSSDAKRALETARLSLGEDVRLEISKEIRELSLGEWEGRLISDLRAENREKLEAWYRTPSTVRLEGGEDLGEFRKRVVSFFDRVIGSPDGGDAAVVTHGGVICVYLTHLLGMPVDGIWSFSLPNASITAITLDFKPRLRTFGDAAHLEEAALGFDGMPTPL